MWSQVGFTRRFTTNKASGSDGIPVELFQILKDDGVKVMHSICQQIWKTQQWAQDGKRSVFIPIPKKGNAKECSNYCMITFISYASKVMLKILQARLQQYMNRELSDVQAGFWKGRGTRDQIGNICWIMEKVREFQKSIYFSFIDYGKFWKRWEYQTTWPASWETYMQVRKQQLEPDIEQQTGPNWERSTKGCIESPCYLTYIPRSVQSLSCVRFLVTPWTAACQASLSITNSWSLLKLMSI